MAGDPLFAPLLLALGLGEFSMHPATLLEVRRAIRGCDLGALRARAPALLRARDRAGIEAWLHARRGMIADRCCIRAAGRLPCAMRAIMRAMNA